MDIKDQVAIVTGGASGIGKATVANFLNAKAAAVVIADVDGQAARETAKELGGQGKGQVLAKEIDVTKQEDIDAMVDATVKQFGRIDILVNNAGICPVVAWEQTNLENWNHILAVNLTSAYLCSKAVLVHMRSRQYGRIVCISSAGAFVGSLVSHVGYGVSKAGMIALVKSMAKEFGCEGITANAIAPGTISTPMADSFGESIRDAFVDSTPLKRQGTAKEIADAVLFVVSPLASYVNGATMHVNGGSLLI